MKKPELIIICGSSGSGKSTVSKLLVEGLKLKTCTLCLDNFYKHTVDIPLLNGLPNYDHPEAVDWKRLYETLKEMQNGNSVIVHKYDYVNNCLSSERVCTDDVDIIIFEGIYTLFNECIRNMATIKIFIETNFDECLCRRIMRDMVERGRDIESIILQWRNVVRPMYDQFIFPLRKHADFIISWDKPSMNVIHLINEILHASEK